MACCQKLAAKAMERAVQQGGEGGLGGKGAGEQGGLFATCHLPPAT